MVPQPRNAGGSLGEGMEPVFAVLSRFVVNGMLADVSDNDLDARKNHIA
jgi:hypothetical protein